MTFGPLFFAAPLALLALIALPLLFLILRAAPPLPKRTFFPPLQLLLGLKTEEESRQRAPLWLVLLRALAAALMIIGFARPSLAPKIIASTSGPTLIVIDDGWTSAPFWSRVQAAASDEIAEAERAHKEVFVLTTAPTLMPREAGEALSPADARNRVAQLQPAAWRPDRADAQQRLAKAPARFGKILWLTDGLGDGNVAGFSAALMQHGPLTVRLPARTAQAIVAVAETPDAIEANIRRASGGPPAGAIAAETPQGRSLGAMAYKYPTTSDTVAAGVKLPPEIAARASRVRIVSEASAGAVRLLPSGAGRPFVGMVDPGGQAQPLLSDLFYVERAIAPFATTRRGDAQSLIQQGAQAIVLPDASRLSPPDRAALGKWIEGGGLLIRFAGPRLANDVDDLVPVRLRPGARALGGALAWETPQPLAPFPDESPFAGLAPPPDATVSKQVLADPTSEREAHVWARLKDGAGIVTAAQRGKGLIVLFHITAGPDWSLIPLSGLYVDMLRRTLAIAGRAQGATQEAQPTGPWLPERLIDGFGALVQPGAEAKPIAADAMNNPKPGPAIPPGLYVRAGSPAVAIDAASSNEDLQPIALPAGAAIAGLEGVRTHPLSGIFLAIAALMIALDLFLSLILAGKMPRIDLRTSAGAAVIALLALLIPAPRAHAAPPQGAAAATLETRLAYIKSGDARRDRITQQGLAALTQTLTERTAVEPAAPVGLDPAHDDLSPYPILYWAAPDSPTRLPDSALANLDRYMRLGGLLFLDTRDADRARAAGAAGPAQIMMQGLDAPPLEAVGANHVLTKTFYLMQSFPGRAARTKIYAETASAAAARDGVPALIIGDGDWASEWAADSLTDTDNDARQRELSLRFGVNLVMLALTGNYKADQVHVHALLERLGQRAHPHPSGDEDDSGDLP